MIIRFPCGSEVVRHNFSLLFKIDFSCSVIAEKLFETLTNSLPEKARNFVLILKPEYS